MASNRLGLAWWKELSNSMKDLGFACLNSDARIFVCQEGTRLTMAVVYVDDAMFFGKNEKLVKNKKALFMANGNAEILYMLRNFCAYASHALDLVSPLISATTLRKS